MSKLINLSIDVTKIDKSKLFEGKKGTYLKLTVAVNDDKDDYGNDVSCWQEQTPEERTNKERKTFLGNGKTFWTDEFPNEKPNKPLEQSTYEPVQDDLPF